MKKKILIVSNLSWNLYNFRLSLMNAMRDEGYEVIAVAAHDRYSQKIIDAGFEFHEVKMNVQGINPMEDLKTMYSFYQLFKELSPDAVCQYTIKPNIYGSMAATFLKIKTINNTTGIGLLFSKGNFLSKILKLLYVVSFRKVDRVFFQNSDDLDFFIKNGLVKSTQCDVLPGSGVDVERFKPQDREQSEKIKFLLVSRMIWEKGIAEYVKAAEEIKKVYPNVEFSVLGFLDVENPSAITKSQMDKWVNEGNIRYLGYSDNVDEFIHNADCIVLPSYYPEGTPKVLLESGSCGKPIITTDTVGCRNVVDHGVNGYLCEPRSWEDLKLKMEMFLKLEHDARVEMGRESREKIVREFDDKIVINKYLNLLRSPTINI